MAQAIRRPTLRDVAQRAGVSFKTVSRVVNGEAGVSDDLVERVETAVTALGYQPDDRARRLRQGGSRTGAIGFVLVDIANPFFSSILRGIEEVARRADCLVLAGSTDGSIEREHQLVEAFVARRVDGLIVVSSSSDAQPLHAELRRGTPVVFLDLEPDGIDADLVRSDHHGGAVLATTHLIDRGHREIAFLGDDPHVFSARLRVDGYRDAMAAAGLRVIKNRIVHHRVTATEWRDIACAYLSEPRPPTALFTAQNFVTIGVTHALHDMGLHERIALVGFDDVELADVVKPGITVVPQQPKELGKQAAEMLFDRIAGDTGPRPALDDG
jgi:LacI family transcriptional regulator